MSIPNSDKKSIDKIRESIIIKLDSVELNNQLKNPKIGLPVMLHSLKTIDFNGVIGLLNSDKPDD